MNTLKTSFLQVTLAAVAVLGASAAMAEPTGKTRDEVVAELKQARDSGEIAALSAEQAGVGGLQNGLDGVSASQLAAKKAGKAVAVNDRKVVR